MARIFKDCDIVTRPPTLTKLTNLVDSSKCAIVQKNIEHSSNTGCKTHHHTKPHFVGTLSNNSILQEYHDPSSEQVV